MLDANNSEPQVGIEPTTACDQTLPDAPEGGVNRNQSKLTDAGSAEQSPNWRRETQPNRNLSPDAVSTPAPRPEALPAGRELDALVAQRVMGWVRDGGLLAPPVGDERRMWCAQWDDDGRPHWLPAYSTDIAAAWQVVEKLTTLSYDVAVIASVRGQCGCEVAKPAWRGSEVVYATFAPLAICRAALAAVERDS